MFKKIRMFEYKDSMTALFFNKQVLAIFLFASACAAVNPYKNIFGVKVIGLPELYYGIVMLLSGIVITFFSIYFGIKSDKEGSFVKYILACCVCGLVGNIALYIWPNQLIYFISNCLLLPVFSVLNSLIFGYAAAKKQQSENHEIHNENAALRSTYSLGYVLTLGVIGSIALVKDDLVLVWLFAGIFAGLIFLLFSNEKLVCPRQKSSLASESILKVFTKKNLMKLVSVSLVTNMLFTLDATVPLIIVGQAGGEYSSIGIFEAGIAVFEVFFIFYWSKQATSRKASNVIIVGALLFALSNVLLSMTQNMIHVYLLVPLVALGASCLISIPIGYLQSLATGRAGVGSSLLSISFFISSSVSSLVYFSGTYFFETKGAIWFSSAVGVIGLAALYLFNRERVS
ncbi:hypothetical protein [Aliikangiella coralliicola]|uniref:MFS transporter n=1 Tax=Aliikangiella coralliicola TaxID=2592383 RepID=A0A545U0E4_9GAMM|nr:hypothetical protein [Aliikangiella coralliicola]TQV82934.1 hypothetical protein FLL46_24500 [Aliikangiella coralliicola]